MNKSRKWFENACDELWRHLVKMRAEFKCQYCRKTGFSLEAHHVFPRVAKSTRWDLDNGVCLCGFPRECHKHAQEYPAMFKRWYEIEIGTKAYQSLKERYYKPTQQRMEDIYEYLKNEMGKYIC